MKALVGDVAQLGRARGLVGRAVGLLPREARLRVIRRSLQLEDRLLEEPAHREGARRLAAASRATDVASAWQSLLREARQTSFAPRVSSH